MTDHANRQPRRTASESTDRVRARSDAPVRPDGGPIDPIDVPETTRPAKPDLVDPIDVPGEKLQLDTVARVESQRARAERGTDAVATSDAGDE